MRELSDIRLALEHINAHSHDETLDDFFDTSTTTSTCTGLDINPNGNNKKLEEILFTAWLRGDIELPDIEG